MLPSAPKVNPFGDDDDLDFSAGAWGAPRASTTASTGLAKSEDSQDMGAGLGLSSSDILRDTIKKEGVIKDIAAAQEDLKTLLNRIGTVEGEIEKLRSGNSTLQLYIDTVTKQIAKR